MRKRATTRDGSDDDEIYGDDERPLDAQQCKIIADEMQVANAKQSFVAQVFVCACVIGLACVKLYFAYWCFTAIVLIMSTQSSTFTTFPSLPCSLKLNRYPDHTWLEHKDDVLCTRHPHYPLLDHLNGTLLSALELTSALCFVLCALHIIPPFVTQQNSWLALIPLIVSMIGFWLSLHWLHGPTLLDNTVDTKQHSFWLIAHTPLFGAVWLFGLNFIVSVLVAYMRKIITDTSKAINDLSLSQAAQCTKVI
ncbi:hypothetical protein Pelo_12079 [Pelomyxa schiedti]|nr:hypothetical protein Pelo_12079 [Pelomyxa schiedti]